MDQQPHQDYCIGGRVSTKPQYGFGVTVFANTLQDSHKKALTSELTHLVLKLEGTNDNLLNSARVWVMFHEVADGNWGGAGEIYRLKELMRMMQS